MGMPLEEEEVRERIMICLSARRPINYRDFREWNARSIHRKVKVLKCDRCGEIIEKDDSVETIDGRILCFGCGARQLEKENSVYYRQDFWGSDKE